MMAVVDLREAHTFIHQYVELRNRYKDLLLTKKVTTDETVAWLEREDVEVRCLVRDNLLLGAVVLYPSKENEVTFFVKEPGKGAGNRLLGIIEDVAKEKGIIDLWAWVLQSNTAARKSFQKREYDQDSIFEREFNGSLFEGIMFHKTLKQR